MALLNFENAVDYHYHGFPPNKLDYELFFEQSLRATEALARYDQMLKTLHNNDILLGPLRSRDAVVSSRMEGTISTVDEVLHYEADQDEDEEHRSAKHRSEAIETYLHARALKMAEAQIKDGHEISKWMLRSAHKILLGFGLGAGFGPGEFKTEQNYLADRGRQNVLFVPISPEFLEPAMDDLMIYIDQSKHPILLRAAIAHLEIEALHPFQDGNGRIGRMLITLMLWRYNALSAPHFYISEYFERHKDQYIDEMRAVSKSGDWVPWIQFFLDGVEIQARENLQRAEAIRDLYEDLKGEFRDVLNSKWSMHALDFLFERPYFRNFVFKSRSGIPTGSSQRIVNALEDKGYLRVVVPAAGSRSALYVFEPLLELVRAP